MLPVRSSQVVVWVTLVALGCADFEDPRDSSFGNTQNSCRIAAGKAQVLPRGLHVVGNAIQDAAGARVVLRGVNRSGSEYACLLDQGNFDGLVDDRAVKALLSWNINAVRIPLNESCWLGIKGGSSAYSGEAHKAAIKSYVARLEANGIVPILELHRAAPADAPADKLYPMPNADHSLDFWRDVARTFIDDDAVVFEAYNEPFPDSNRDTEAAWSCWRDGCTQPRVVWGGTEAFPEYEAVGMQELVSAIREVGSTHLILLGGVQYSNRLSRWLSYAPQDPLGNIAAAWHVYNFNACSNATCWDNEAAAVAAVVPLVATEIGQDDCAGTMVTPLMEFLDAQQSSYLAWWWNTSSGPCMPPETRGDGPPLSLITDYYCPKPKSDFGQAIYDHYMKFAN